MALQDELLKLRTLLDNEEMEKASELTAEIRKNYTSQEDKDRIDEFISAGLDQLIEETDIFINDMKIRMQLIEILDVVSISYIAKKYFNKSRQWLYQKINGNTKNGKTVRFTQSEIDTFNFALQDISKKIGSIAIHS
ncbi:MAG: DUF5053 domain-containing protein [Prevotella sp.]|jgi:hypothetical protein|nr:DUF5053 domain-containing protein [Prevotella sp.]